MEQDKLSNLNNNTLNNTIINNNNPVKCIKDGNVTVVKDGFNDNNNHMADSSPISESPNINETIYEFGSHFENPSHVISEKVKP